MPLPRRWRPVRESSRRGKLPTANSSRSRSLRSRSRLRSLGRSLDSLGSLCNLRSLGRSLGRIARRAAAWRRFPCQRRRTFPGSRRRFLPRRERFREASRNSATVCRLPVRRLMRMLRPSAKRIRRQFRQLPTQAGPSADRFASKFASHAPFRFLPYFRANVSMTRDALPGDISTREAYACSTACSTSEESVC